MCPCWSCCLFTVSLYACGFSFGAETFKYTSSLRFLPLCSCSAVFPVILSLSDTYAMLWSHAFLPVACWINFKLAFTRFSVFLPLFYFSLCPSYNNTCAFSKQGHCASLCHTLPSDPGVNLVHMTILLFRTGLLLNVFPSSPCRVKRFFPCVSV